MAARLEVLSKPAIAAINGYAAAAASSPWPFDIRLASEQAKIGRPEINLGILPGWGGTQRLACLTSPGLAEELIFTGRTVTADEAARAGLVDHVSARRSARKKRGWPTRSPPTTVGQRRRNRKW